MPGRLGGSELGTITFGKIRSIEGGIARRDQLRKTSTIDDRDLLVEDPDDFIEARRLHNVTRSPSIAARRLSARALEEVSR